jgi:hypothetical protein
MRRNPVLVKVADIQGGDLGATEANLQASRQKSAVAKTAERVRRRRVEQLANLRFGKSSGAAFVAIDRRALYIHHGIAGGDTMSGKMFEQAGQRGEAAALTLHPFPRDDGAIIEGAELVDLPDAKRPHEVTHVEPIGAARTRALLVRQPDFFSWDGGEPRAKPRSAPAFFVVFRRARQNPFDHTHIGDKGEGVRKFARSFI